MVSLKALHFRGCPLSRRCKSIFNKISQIKKSKIFSSKNSGPDLDPAEKVKCPPYEKVN
jgi:hypothetical protein